MSEDQFSNWIFISFTTSETQKVYQPNPLIGWKSLYYEQDSLNRIGYLIAVIYNNEVKDEELTFLFTTTINQPMLVFFHLDNKEKLEKKLSPITTHSILLERSNLLLPANVSESDIRDIISSHVKGNKLSSNKIQNIHVYTLKEQNKVSFIKNDLKSNIWADASMKRILFYIALHGRQSLSEIESRVTVRFGNSAFSKLAELEEPRLDPDDGTIEYKALESTGNTYRFTTPELRDIVSGFIVDEFCITTEMYANIITDINGYFSEDNNMLFEKVRGICQRIAPNGLSEEDQLKNIESNVKHFILTDANIVVFVVSHSTNSSITADLAFRLQAALFNLDTPPNNPYIPVLVAPVYTTEFMQKKSTDRFRKTYLLDAVSVIGLECQLRNEDLRNKVRNKVRDIFTNQPKAGLWDPIRNLKAAK